MGVEKTTMGNPSIVQMLASSCMVSLGRRLYLYYLSTFHYLSPVSLKTSELGIKTMYLHMTCCFEI